MLGEGSRNFQFWHHFSPSFAFAHLQKACSVEALSALQAKMLKNCKVPLKMPSSCPALMQNRDYEQPKSWLTFSWPLLGQSAENARPWSKWMMDSHREILPPGLKPLAYCEWHAGKWNNTPPACCHWKGIQMETELSGWSCLEGQSILFSKNQCHLWWWNLFRLQ